MIRQDDVQPFLKLWGEVMRLGVADFCTARASRSQGEGHPATIWFWSDDVHTGSFVWLCHLFDLDPTHARSQVLKQWRAFVDRSQVFNRKGE